MPCTSILGIAVLVLAWMTTGNFNKITDYSGALKQDSVFLTTWIYFSIRVARVREPLVIVYFCALAMSVWRLPTLFGCMKKTGQHIIR